jgi:hypothetical protein
LLRGTHHTLVLFGGPTPSAATWEHLTDIVREVHGQHGENMRAYILVDGTEIPEALVGYSSVVLDTEGAAHHRYQAELPMLYLVRPDGYIGFRSRPADHPALTSHLTHIFK